MFDIKENLKKLPDTPGVYMHKDGLGNVIYVGKAISLKRRVSQYFQARSQKDPKTRALVSEISEFEYINCATEMEALILECNLIKKYEPKYNILLRDDKTYPYIKVSVQDDYPRVLKTRIIDHDGAKYFGPYSDTLAVNETIDLVNRLYSLKRCSAKSWPNGYRPCLNYHIGECVGICTGDVSKESYMERIKEVLDFLSGKNHKIVNVLTEKMKNAASEMDYEKAAEYRDLISHIKSLEGKQRVTMLGGKDLDMVMPIITNNKTAVCLFQVRDGKLSGRETFNMDVFSEADYDDVVSNFIKQYYTQWANVPSEIIVSKPLKENDLLENLLSKDGRKVRIFTPERGEKKALLDLARRDVGQMTDIIETKAENERERDFELRNALSTILGVEKDTYRVESYDISNTNGVDTVGAMVVFSNLKPVKKDYRRFKIRTVNGPDDYGSLREMLLRRFKRALEGDKSFSILPDLILMDGGQGQVTTCEKALSELGIEIPVLGMAKDDNHRTRALVSSNGSEIELKNYPLLFKYCGTIQEEVHRFAIEYHRSLHSKNTIGSILDEIPGIGPKKRNALLKYFKSVEDIKNASYEELEKCPGISSMNAVQIKKFFS